MNLFDTFQRQLINIRIGYFIIADTHEYFYLGANNLFIKFLEFDKLM